MSVACFWTVGAPVRTAPVLVEMSGKIGERRPEVDGVVMSWTFAKSPRGMVVAYRVEHCDGSTGWYAHDDLQPATPPA